jgi:hypothetical protein
MKTKEQKQKANEYQKKWAASHRQKVNEYARRWKKIVTGGN